MAEPERINWVALSNALTAGATDDLDGPTRAEYDRVVAQANEDGVRIGEPAEVTPAQQAADQFWADVVQFEADAAPIVAELGEGTIAHDQFIADIEALSQR